MIVNFRDAGKHDQAFRVSNTALAIFENDRNILVVKAHTAWDVKNYPLAAKCFHDIRVHHPFDFEAWFGEIESLYFSGSHHELTQVLEDSFGLFGDRVELLYVKAKLEFLAQHKTNSLKLFSEIYSKLESSCFTYGNSFGSAYLLPNLERLSVAVAANKGKKWGERGSIKSRENFIKNVDVKIKKVIVTSIPKAGTHLVSKLLSELGVSSSQLFMEPDTAVLEIDSSFGGNRVYEYKNLNGYPDSFINRLPINVHTSLSLLRHNEHVMCHLPPTSIPLEWLEKTKILAVFRDPKKTIVSEFLTECRLYNEAPPYNYDPELEYILGSGLALDEMFVVWLKRYLLERRDLYDDMLQWRNHATAFCFKYEDLVSTSGMLLVDRIAEYLEIDFDRNDESFIDRLINSETPTKSGDNSTVRNLLWSESAFSIYCSSGFDKIEREIANLCVFENGY